MAAMKLILNLHMQSQRVRHPIPLERFASVPASLRKREPHNRPHRSEIISWLDAFTSTGIFISNSRSCPRILHSSHICALQHELDFSSKTANTRVAHLIYFG